VAAAVAVLALNAVLVLVLRRRRRPVATMHWVLVGVTSLSAIVAIVSVLA
jgi:hypothetical protein